MDMTRRDFIQKSSLVIGATMVGRQLSLFNPAVAKAETGTTFKPHAFVEIAADETVTVWLGQTNLGQGTHTGIPMIIADELDGDWQKVEAKMALAADVFKNPHWHMQVTGGSTSIRHRWDMLRKAGAAARQMLRQAAADKWQLEASQCATENGRVIHPDGRVLTYGQLVAAARMLPVPDDPPLKNKAEYRIIGTERQRLDIADKVAGRTKYGIDVVLPEMCIAVVARPPQYGATPLRYDEQAAMGVKGVLKVVALENRIAVCAETTHAALKGREQLAVHWSEGSHPGLDDTAVDRLLAQALQQDGAVAEARGDTAKAMAEAATILESSYRLPYLSHAQLEPVNCTAHVLPDLCRIWMPTQGQTAAQLTASSITGLSPEKIEVMTTPAGGGFGLRGEVDSVVDAVSLSQVMKRPVKVMWTREDDFQNDYFRPGCVTTIKGALDENGTLIGWSQKLASSSIMTRIMPQMVENGLDDLAYQGIPDMVYQLPNRQVEYVMMNLPIPVGFWRSVGYSITTFTVETFIDQLAHAAGKDPLHFRMELLEKGSRPHRTLSLLADKTGWGSPVPAGRARGLALGHCFGSAAAHMAEVSVNPEDGQVTVHRIVCTIDCGPAIYPDAIVAQMEGATIMALSVAFNERIRFAKGGVATTNYDQYPLLTMSAVPEIEVHISDSVHGIGGVGEPGVPPVAPAVANGIFAATGVMATELPFRQELLQS